MRAFFIRNKIIMKNEKGGTTMNVSTCLNILREIKDVAFATVDENNQPQVRIIAVSYTHLTLPTT
mgnify:CR=1 FL=1